MDQKHAAADLIKLRDHVEKERRGKAVKSQDELVTVHASTMSSSRSIPPTSTRSLLLLLCTLVALMVSVAAGGVRADTRLCETQFLACGGPACDDAFIDCIERYEAVPECRNPPRKNNRNAAP